MTNPTVGDILTQAVAVMDERGWTTHTVCDDQGRVCVQGAINVVLCGSPSTLLFLQEFLVAKEVYQALFDHIPEDFMEKASTDHPQSNMIFYNNSLKDRPDGYTLIREWFEKTIADTGTTLP